MAALNRTDGVPQWHSENWGFGKTTKHAVPKDSSTPIKESCPPIKEAIRAALVWRESEEVCKGIIRRGKPRPA